MNHYPKHIGDWMVATAHLSEIEECMYARLIDCYYAREAPLPLAIEAVCRLARAASAAAKRAVETVLREFFSQASDGWHQKRCDQEIAAFRAKAMKCAKSASARWDPGNANAYAIALRTHDRTHMPSQSVGNANQEPITNNQEPEPLKPEVQDHGACSPSAPPPVAQNGHAKTAGNGAAKHRAERLADDWRLPEAWRDWAVMVHRIEPQKAVRLSLDFRDYWIAKSGAQATKLDWQATWRRWVRKAVGDA